MDHFTEPVGISSLSLLLPSSVLPSPPEIYIICKSQPSTNGLFLASLLKLAMEDFLRRVMLDRDGGKLVQKWMVLGTPVSMSLADKKMFIGYDFGSSKIYI